MWRSAVIRLAAAVGAKQNNNVVGVVGGGSVGAKVPVSTKGEICLKRDG
jgi:hypothetical protein